jgi:hypothetical protein
VRSRPMPREVRAWEGLGVSSQDERCLWCRPHVNNLEAFSITIKDANLTRCVCRFS